MTDFPDRYLPWLEKYGATDTRKLLMVWRNLLEPLAVALGEAGFDVARQNFPGHGGACRITFRATYNDEPRIKIYMSFRTREVTTSEGMYWYPISVAIDTQSEDDIMGRSDIDIKLMDNETDYAHRIFMSVSSHMSEGLRMLDRWIIDGERSLKVYHQMAIDNPPKRQEMKRNHQHKAGAVMRWRKDKKWMSDAKVAVEGLR